MYILSLPRVISCHLSSCQSWWGGRGGKPCYIDRQYVHLHVWNQEMQQDMMLIKIDKVNNDVAMY